METVNYDYFARCISCRTNLKLPNSPYCARCTAENEEREKLFDTLTAEQEDKLKEAHAEDYHGTDDDMPDAFEGWLEHLSLDELKQILK